MLYYLANPYRHLDRKVEDDRILKTAQAIGGLVRYAMKHGTVMNIFSPVIHNSTVYRTNLFNPAEMEYVFRNFDFEMLEKADRLIVLTLDGWNQSQGVALEIDFCQKRKKPVHYFSLEEILSEAESLGKLL